MKAKVYLKSRKAFVEAEVIRVNSKRVVLDLGHKQITKRKADLKLEEEGKS